MALAQQGGVPRHCAPHRGRELRRRGQAPRIVRLMYAYVALVENLHERPHVVQQAVLGLVLALVLLTR